MQGTIGRHDLPSERRVRPTAIVGHAPAGLFHKQRPRGDVPRVEVLFPERIKPAGRDVAQVQRRRPQPPDRARLGEKRGKNGQLLLSVVAGRLKK